MRTRTLLCAVLLGAGCQWGYWRAYADDVLGTTSVRVGEVKIVSFHVELEADASINQWSVFLKPTAMVLTQAAANGNDAIIKIEVIEPVPAPDDMGETEWFHGHADDTGVGPADPVDSGVDVVHGSDRVMANLDCPGAQPTCSVDVQFGVSVVGGESDVDVSWVASEVVTGPAHSCETHQPKGTITLEQTQ